jgi:type I restriction enzyme S subunit
MADPGHGVMIEEDVDAVFASYLIRFRPKDAIFARFLQYWLRSDDYWDLVGARYAGTTRASLNAQVLSAFQLVRPSERVVQVFSTTIGALRSKVISNVLESENLADLRNALLPKLISGELRVKCAERLLEA